MRCNFPLAKINAPQRPFNRMPQVRATQEQGVRGMVRLERDHRVIANLFLRRPPYGGRDLFTYLPRRIDVAASNGKLTVTSLTHISDRVRST